MENLTENNFLIYSMKHYENPNCTTLDEFNKDMSHIKHLKRLLKRYQRTGVIRERLVLNHIILLNNVLTEAAMVKILFFKFDEELWPYMVPFLRHLNLLPAVVYGIRGKNIHVNIIREECEIEGKLSMIR